MGAGGGGEVLLTMTEEFQTAERLPPGGCRCAVLKHVAPDCRDCVGPLPRTPPGRRTSRNAALAMCKAGPFANTVPVVQPRRHPQAETRALVQDGTTARIQFLLVREVESHEVFKRKGRQPPNVGSHDPQLLAPCGPHGTDGAAADKHATILEEAAVARAPPPSPVLV